jgi:PAS domain S-box-containing protein
LLVASSRSVLAVPIRYKGRAIGAISVESQRTNPFDDTDVATVTLVADQLTIAVRGAGLFEQTQAQLREISMFRRLADEASVGIITRDFDGIIDYSNPAAATLFGFSDSAVMHGLSMRSLYPDDNAYETDKQLCVEAMREGAWNGEITLQKLDGQPIVVDMSIFPIYAPDGAFMSYATVLRDSTERRRLLNATQQSNARFEAILEATEDGIIVWDKSGRIVMVNAAASRLLNTAPEALIGLTQADLAQTHPLVVAAANADEGERIEFLADVRRIGRCRNLPWHSNRASGFLTVIYDITSQVELEQSREELTSMLIHDLLGPLTGIVGGIEMVRDMIVEGESQERVLRFLEMAQRNANLLLDTANSLLDIAQLESGRMNLTYTPLEAGVLLADATGMFENIAHAAGISINTSCEANLPPLLVDAGMIRRALTNLLDNALKFTPGGGQVSIAATREGENLVRFSVSDTGPGIPEAYRWRIFEKYVQVPEQEGRRRGKGLGLVFCRLVAEAHQGRVWVEPRPGGGCVFVLTVAGASPTQ